jgi:putative membrane protein insertion efficiency factor
MKAFLKNIFNIPKYLLISLIDIYQATLSPDHGWLKAKYPYGYCRHYPSCSEYSKQSIQKFGVIKGGWLSVKRISSCNPWTESKIDLIPNSLPAGRQANS